MSKGAQAVRRALGRAILQWHRPASTAQEGGDVGWQRPSDGLDDDRPRPDPAPPDPTPARPGPQPDPTYDDADAAA